MVERLGTIIKRRDFYHSKIKAVLKRTEILKRIHRLTLLPTDILRFRRMGPPATGGENSWCNSAMSLRAEEFLRLCLRPRDVMDGLSLDEAGLAANKGLGEWDLVFTPEGKPDQVASVG